MLLQSTDPALRNHGGDVTEREIVNQLLVDYFRCPEEYCSHQRTARGSSSEGNLSILSGLAPAALMNVLPRAPAEFAESLRLERYVSASNGQQRNFANWKAIKSLYYGFRSFLPRDLRRKLQKLYFHDWKSISFPSWPVDRTADRIFEALLVQSIRELSVDAIPFIWFWPDQAQSCTAMTHDVETTEGRDFCLHIMDLDDRFGIKASFQIVPEGRYEVPENFLQDLRSRGFEINVQDLNHDGRLFDDHDEFLRRVRRINQYGKAFKSAGFRAAVLYRNPDWYPALDFSYDMSIPTVANLEPQRGGCCTIMPFFIGKLLELPVTTTQDCSLFYVLGDYSTSVWQRQLTAIIEHHGMASFLVHPDYVIESRAQDTYKQLLESLARLRDDGKTWIALPREIDSWWRMRQQMTLVRNSNGWQIEGVGKERARIAYAHVENDQIAYTF